MEKKERNWEVRVKICEERTEEIVKEIKDLKEAIENIVCDKEIVDSEAETGRSIRSGKTGSVYSLHRRESSITGSNFTDISDDRLSTREVGKLKRWMIDKEKEERRNNFVIKGIGNEEYKELVKKDAKDIKEWVTNLFRNKLGIESKIEYCRWSGKVIIGKVSNREEKHEIMRRKYKLKGERIYIEHDLTWEKRKVQEKIFRWVKEKREKGEEVKVGVGKIQIKGMWKRWEVIEKEMEENERTKTREVNTD